MLRTNVLPAFAVIAACAVMMTSGACSETVASSDGLDLAALNNVVAVKVGDGEITARDVLCSFASLKYLNDFVVTLEIYKQEARKRGVYPKPEDLDKAVQDALSMIGGEDVYLNQVAAGLPRQVALNALRDQHLFTLLRGALAEDEYLKQHGAPSEQEIADIWQRDEQMHRNAIAMEKSIPPEEVTLDMARERIEEQIKGTWMNENAERFLQTLKDSYVVQNIIVEKYNALYPPDIDVPEMPEPAESSEQSEPENESESGGN